MSGGGRFVFEGVSGISGAGAAVWSRTGCAGASIVGTVASVIEVDVCGRATAVRPCSSWSDAGCGCGAIACRCGTLVPWSTMCRRERCVESSIATVGGVNLRKKRLFLSDKRPDPSTLTQYWSWSLSSTTVPDLSHLVGCGPCWFCRNTRLPSDSGARGLA